MTMITEQQLVEIRCSKCGQKLGEYAMVEGEIRIICRRHAGKGLGTCNRMNVVEVRKICNNSTKNAI